MNPVQEEKINLDTSKFLEKKVFNNEKLMLYNYLEKSLKIEIEDLILLAKSIFVLITGEKYEHLDHKQLLRSMFRLVIERMVFFIPVSQNLHELILAIFENKYIDDIQTRGTPDNITVTIILNKGTKRDFFNKYKKIFDEISIFFKIYGGQEFKFQYM